MITSAHSSLTILPTWAPRFSLNPLQSQQYEKPNPKQRSIFLELYFVSLCGLWQVNIATVEAIRAIHRYIDTGISEQFIRETLNNILIRAGLTPYFNIVLFGSDAANPHGGADETRELKECEFILIDVGITQHRSY